MAVGAWRVHNRHVSSEKISRELSANPWAKPCPVEVIVHEPDRDQTTKHNGALHRFILLQLDERIRWSGLESVQV